LNTTNNYINEETFLLGDFNLSRDGSCYPNILKTHINACDPSKDLRCSDTVTDNTQYYSVDYIFYRNNNHWEVVSAYADHSMTGSDHFPVIAEFRYKSQTSSATTTSVCPVNCSGKQCGNNGCGGSCGTCSGQNACVNGICVCQANCTNKKCGESDGCAGKCTACDQGFTCNTSKWKCESGACQKVCTNKKCGDDGCGGSCGDCTQGKECINNQCQEVEYDTDINGDGKISMFDLTIVLSNWKWEKDPRDEKADINRDGSVNMRDVSMIVNNWTKKY
jgi:hypothetical protein